MRIGHLSFTSYKPMNGPVITVNHNYIVQGYDCLKLRPEKLDGMIVKVVNISLHLTKTDSNNRIISTKCWPGVDLGKELLFSHTCNGKLTTKTGVFIPDSCLQNL